MSYKSVLLIRQFYVFLAFAFVGVVLGAFFYSTGSSSLFFYFMSVLLSLVVAGVITSFGSRQRVRWYSIAFNMSAAASILILGTKFQLQIGNKVASMIPDILLMCIILIVPGVLIPMVLSCFLPND